MTRKTILAALTATLLTPAAGALADCRPIEEPAANPGLEQIKTNMSLGHFGAALDGFDVPTETKNKLIDDLTRTFGSDGARCTTIRRVAQGPYFMSEIVLFEESPQQLFYFVISGQTDGDTFRMTDINITSKYDDVRPLLF
ncbi:hypothetical protein [Chachezhania sediminis]|uniref:hypothetical protein n=1 Tax=Chachezhania sediminis TaxID=2599291 RepID=UPI00131E8A7B|nr:hypothetical protein [Chachezhania sediminis]